MADIIQYPLSYTGEVVNNAIGEAISSIQPSDLLPTVGQSETKGMSQKAITDKFSTKSDVVSVSINSTTKTITHTIVNNSDATYNATNITLIKVILPTTVSHGFYGGINFKSSASPPIVTFQNLSTYPLVLMQYGISTSSYSPTANAIVDMTLYCDGINVYCYINEV